MRDKSFRVVATILFVISIGVAAFAGYSSRIPMVETPKYEAFKQLASVTGSVIETEDCAKVDASWVRVYEGGRACFNPNELIRRQPANFSPKQVYMLWVVESQSNEIGFEIYVTQGSNIEEASNGLCGTLVKVQMHMQITDNEMKALAQTPETSYYQCENLH